MAFKEKLYLSTIGSDSCKLAAKHGLGLEMAEFCTAVNLDEKRESWISSCKEKMRSSDRFTFHAPFNELCPFAVDPLVRDVSRRRYEQAYQTARELGINRMVVHTGHIPILYFDSFFAERSINFWRDFLRDKPEDFELLIENVVDTDPKPIADIMCGVNDKRCRVCLDVGHAFVSSKRDINEWLDVLMPWISHVHVHDNTGDFDRHLPLGDGNIDWESVLNRILDKSPDSTFTLENMECAGSVRWLIEHGFIKE
ncbi:MAG: sugar phosphate isomerase/epimerase [Oscillospiraceae bacterium]|nr:sugar phosphate isomerase/epimerase [Oscillospiraceae bacterium]